MVMTFHFGSRPPRRWVGRVRLANTAKIRLALVRYYLSVIWIYIVPAAHTSLQELAPSFTLIPPVIVPILPVFFFF